MKIHRQFLLLLLISLSVAVLVGCSFIIQTPVPAATETPEVVPTETPRPSPTAAPTETSVPLPEIQTGFGMLVVKSAQLMKSFPPGCTDFCMEPNVSGHVFLVVILEGKDGADAVELGQELGKSSLWSQVSVVTADGFRATAGGGGMMPESFLEFSIPEGSQGLILNWGDNPPIELTVE
jgi:hypothetical protein